MRPRWAVANYYYRTGCQAVGLISGVSGRSLQNPKRGGVWNRTFSKGSKGGASGRNLEERGGADTHTFAKDANVWGTRQALAPRTGKVGQSAPAIIGIKTTRWALCGRMRRRDGRHA